MVRNYKRKTEDRWSKEDLLEALTLIKDNKLKINDAARQFGISRATLYRQYQKFVQSGGKCDINQFRTCGGNPILTKVEEDVLEKTIIDLREQGFSVTSSDIKRICYEYCDSNTIPNQFNTEKRMASDDWYYGFLKRHPEVRSGKLGGLELAPDVKRKRIKEESMDTEEEKPVTTRRIKISKRGRKKKFKGKSPTRSKKVIKSKRNTPKASLTIVQAGNSGNEFASDESCEGQMILGEIENAGEPEPDGETVPIKEEMNNEAVEGTSEDAVENQTEGTKDS